MRTAFTPRRVLILVLTLAGLVIASLAAIHLNTGNLPAPKAAGGPVVVDTAVSRVATIQDAVTAIGTLRAAESVVVKSEISGRVARISFSDGARVIKGDELIVFDAGIQQAQVQQARAERDLASAKLKRTQELFGKKFLSAAALDDAQASEQIAQAKLALAQATLEKMTLRAPFGGVIGIRQISVGDYIKEGADLVNIGDISSMKADFRVPEQLSGRLRVDQTVQLESDAFPGVVFPARVTAIDAAVDASGRSLLLRAELRDGSKRLKPGMFVRVRLVLETRTNAVIIPEEALVTSQGKVSVFKVTDGVAVITPVRVGLRTQVDQKAVVEILEGLAKDERVVTAGQIKIRGSQMPVKSVDARAGAATGAAGGPTAVPASAAGAPTTMNKKAP